MEKRIETIKRKLEKYTKEKNTKIDNISNFQKPIVSIIVPCYNIQDYIFDCLYSLINQTLKEIEIIAVNDGSYDDTLEIINEFSKIDKRIKIINQKNSGLSMARNVGLEAVNGEFVCFVDGDDWIDYDFVEKLYNAIIKNNCDIAGASIIRKRKYTQKYRIHYKEEKVYKTLREKIEICKVPKCCYVWNKIYRFEKIKNFKFKKGVYFEDCLWLPEVLAVCGDFASVSNVNYYYRVNNNSIVKKLPNSKKQLDSYNAKKYILEFFKNNNLPLNDKTKTITRKTIYFLNIPILKIKEFENRMVYVLFGILKISKSKNKLSKKEIKELNHLYENGEIQNLPKVKTKYETLEELINSNKSITRFGDGEFNLIFGEDLPFQEYDRNLALKLKEILLNNNENLLTALPDVFGNLEEYNKNARDYWRKFIVKNRGKIYPLLNFDKQYYYAGVSRPFMDLEDKSKVGLYFEAFKNVWKNKDIVFIEGCASRLGYKNDLFENAKSIRRIIAPAKNAYRKYEEILAAALSIAQSRDLIFILALGPCATALAYDLSLKGFRALDLGHVDIEYEWFLRNAKRKIAIKDKYVNEAKNGKKITSVDDEKYNNEIICNCED